MKKSFFLVFRLIVFIVAGTVNGYSQHITKPIIYHKWIQNFVAADSLRGVTTFSNIPIAFFMAYEDGVVEQYEKLEIGINLPEDAKMQIANFVRSGRGINPFDPDQISIQANFLYSDYSKDANDKTNRTNFETESVYAFYYEEFHHETNDDRFKHGYWKKDTTSYNFRIRFAPRKIGWWTCTINISIGGELKYTLPSFDFLCVESGKQGFITGISDNKRLLQFENGENFFGIGQNIPIADMQGGIMPFGSGPTRIQPPEGFNLQRSYIEDLAKNGGNLVRIMHGEWVDALEWEKLNDYSMNMNFAWEFDQTIDLCWHYGVHILWLQQVHTAFMGKNPYGDDRIAWPGNPYHVYLKLNKPEEFFTNEKAIKAYKNKIRYMLSRWGYSRMIAGIQPMSEMNEMAANITDLPIHHPYMTDSVFRNNVAKWFRIMKNYIQKDLGYDYLVGSSFTGDVGATVSDDPVMKIADFNDYHPYGQGRNENLGARFGGINITPGYGIFKRYNKPTIIGEMGTWDIDYLHECHENEFHNDVWATTFMGGWAGGLFWHDWEDNWNNDLRENFKGLKAFLYYQDFTLYEWTPKRWPEKNIDDSTYSEKEKNYFEVIYMTREGNGNRGNKAIGWIHNRSAYWYNYEETDCEKQLIETKSKSKNGKKRFRPADDDAGGLNLYKGDENKKKRLVEIKGLKRMRNYVIYFYSTEDAEKVEKITAFSGIGNLTIEIPEGIDYETYYDFAFSIIQKKDDQIRVKF